MRDWRRERYLPIGSNRSGQNDRCEGVVAPASRATLLYRGRHFLVFHQQRGRTRIARQFSGAGAVDDGSGGSVRALGFRVLIDFSIPPGSVESARKILKEVPFDFVVLRPSLRVCLERAALRQEGAINDYVMLKNFYARFEEGPVEPICDDDADPNSLARRIADGLNQGKFRVLNTSTPEE